MENADATAKTVQLQEHKPSKRTIERCAKYKKKKTELN